MELGERYELKEEAYFTQAQAFPSWVTVKLGKGLVQVINCPHWDKEIGILPLKQDFFFFFLGKKSRREIYQETPRGTAAVCKEVQDPVL